MFIRYEYVKLIAVNFSRQKELDADSKAILQTEFVEQLKNTDDKNFGAMFILTILQKSKEARLKFFQRNVNGKL